MGLAALAAGIGLLAAQGEALALPNPASVFCIQQGGRVEIVRDRAGNERGICVLPDGRRVDEWKYFRAHQRRK
jgi:hypothetical protein